jgi:hypothetical protein
MQIFTADYGYGGTIVVVADDIVKAQAMIDREVELHMARFESNPRAGNNDKIKAHDILHGFVHIADGDFY